LERRERLERVTAREVAGKEIEDPIELEIEAALELVFAANPGHRVRELRALDRRLARAEEVAPDRQDRGPALPDRRLGQVGVREAGFAVAGPLEPRLVQERGSDDARQARVERPREHVRRAGVLQCVLRTAALE